MKKVATADTVNFFKVFLLLYLIFFSLPVYSQIKRGNQDSPIISPDIYVLDQNGQRINFYRGLIQDKTVVINFIYTRCTSSCPISSSVFGQVQQKVKNQTVHFISISVDPTNDTPEKLLNFANSFKAGPNWHFVTGEQDSIKILLESFNAFNIDKNAHPNTVWVGNAARGNWQRLFGLPSANDIIKTLKLVQ
jgi:protein SCO1